MAPAAMQTTAMPMPKPAFAPALSSFPPLGGAGEATAVAGVSDKLVALAANAIAGIVAAIAVAVDVVSGVERRSMIARELPLRSFGHKIKVGLLSPHSPESGLSSNQQGSVEEKFNRTSSLPDGLA